ncbi:hypothetical protein DCAR_0934977 [Daucus carota subsp. sativus]|uniref:Uncharacterized protein n=2 Tax=Daucus carota subsp. sativus TaxID=79200 RepID=A0AAF0Y026_DAUCS|nr:hypothetical protein DCAR_0934977 [Daucus carota subsp. sativus]
MLCLVGGKGIRSGWNRMAHSAQKKNLLFGWAKEWNGPFFGSFLSIGSSKWQTTSMPWFTELCTIFGKDRATGNLAENLADVVEELNTEAADELSVQEAQPVTHSDESTSMKKRKRGNADALLEAVYAVSDRLANQFEASTKLLIAAEEDMREKKKQLNQELSKIPELEVLQKLQVAKRIASDEDLMILFFEAPAAEKTVLLNAILNKEI